VTLTGHSSLDSDLPMYEEVSCQSDELGSGNNFVEGQMDFQFAQFAHCQSTPTPTRGGLSCRTLGVSVKGLIQRLLGIIIFSGCIVML